MRQLPDPIAVVSNLLLPPGNPASSSGGINLNAGHRVGDVLLGDHPGDIPRPRHAATAFII
jgi:hypothetical protein